MSRFSKSRTLQIALFATGCSGIVAEFVLSTLATYLLGNATFQWTLIMSIMLFAMGAGSGYSRYFQNHLLDTFVLVEFLLSSLCCLSALICFGLSPFMESKELVIYPLAFSIGFLIGLEIPIATRINSQYQELKTNISRVLEMDYFGSLAGGILFAFFFLPVLGFVYTPIVLGSINFIVAAWLLWRFSGLVYRRRLLMVCFFCVLTILAGSLFFAGGIVTFSEQKKYRDTIIYSRQTRYQNIVMTRWKSHYWLFINGQEQFSTYDEERYHEPLVHPAMLLAQNRSQVLILGGGDGLAAREVLKYPEVVHVNLVDLDPVMLDLAAQHPILKKINQGAMSSPRLTHHAMDASTFLEKSDRLFDVIIIDLPDPDSMDLMHLYAQDFYRQIRRHLTRGGVMVTQASSPFFAREAFLCIHKTVQSAGFSVLALHNDIPTLGQWGWVLGMDERFSSEETLRKKATRLSFDNISTRFINPDAMMSMIHFGKGVFEKTDEIRINQRRHPVLYRYYQKGNWGAY